ncbi:MAG: FkbM family methyltransferase [Proteiniphilum sp.]|nr:FkbM family methyltransferase [Proteiniphilum sp.]
MIHTLIYKVCSQWKNNLHTKKKKKVRKRILDHFTQFPSGDKEINDAVNYLAKHPLTTFFGAFQEKYIAEEIEVFVDQSNGLPYVITDGKRLYFKRSQNRRTVQLMFNGLRIEQDEHAPHCYTDVDFQIEDNEILADVGCAEGYFSLMNIEKTKRIYLFEQDRQWIEALEATFTPWKEKIRIIPKYVSDRNNSNEITLDNYFRQIEEKPGFYKIDVEGAESSVLKGMKEMLLCKPVKIALCTYHHQHDFDLFSRFFEDHRFHHRPNSGVMIYQNDLKKMEPPFFRKCMIKATNHHD